MAYQIFIVDDHPAMRDGVRAIAESTDTLDVCGEATNAHDTLERLSRGLEPDLIIVDLSLPGVSGLDLVKHIHSLYPAYKTLVLSAHAEAVYAERVLRAGARGYVMKSASSTTIAKAILDVLAGEVVLSPEMRTRLLEGQLSGTAQGSPIDRLSDREIEVFAHIGQGRSTAETAEAMCISPKTVESHRASIKKKLGVTSSNQLVQRAAVWAANSGGIPSPM